MPTWRRRHPPTLACYYACYHACHDSQAGGSTHSSLRKTVGGLPTHNISRCVAGRRKVLCLCGRLSCYPPCSPWPSHTCRGVRLTYYASGASLSGQGDDVPG